MPDFDPRADITPQNPLVVNDKPTVAALKAAIAGSGVSASYPAAQLLAMTKNDLVAICVNNSIAVSGL